jgi:PST family polysaccharide transporter
MRVILLPLQTITAVISRVIFPLYSRLQEDKGRIRAAYIRVAKTIALIAFPLMLGIMAMGRPFVLTCFGSDWEPMIALLVIFSPIGLAQAIDATTGSLYQATGRTDWLFRWGIATGIFAVIAFSIGLQWGIKGVALSYLAATAIWTYPGLAIPFKLIDLKVSLIFANLWRPFVASSLMSVSTFCVYLLLAEQFSVGIVLAILCCVALAVYILVSLVINRKDLHETYILIKQSI